MPASRPGEEDSMRRVVCALVMMVALSASGVTREEPRSRDRERSSPVLKVVKKFIKALGDGLTIPTP